MAFAELAIVALATWCTQFAEAEVPCSLEGSICQNTRCCATENLRCYARDSKHAVCKKNCEKGHWFCEVLNPHDGQEFEDRWRGKRSCTARFAAPKPPVDATHHNGVTLPPTCFNASGPHHVFVIGDWGGVLPGQLGNEHGNRVVPADHTKPTFRGRRQFIKGVDDRAQQRVAHHFRARAKHSKPDYVINAGDSLYWGLPTHCGSPIYRHANYSGYKTVFENMYFGPGLEGKQWLGVLGNHDYGGFKFTMGWDHAIGYTWGGGDSSSRWMMPAQYWAASAHYPDFSVDWFFLDSNVWDAHAPEDPSRHNMCSFSRNGYGARCLPHGPKDPRDCLWYFKSLWLKGKAWLKELLERSTSEWQIVVTHFPPSWGHDEWQKLSHWHGIDLIITGHTHRQEIHYLSESRSQYWTGLWEDFLAPTAWIVVGGGGGTTSPLLPNHDGSDDQYGFMDLTLTKTYIRVEAISHGGKLRSTTHVRPRPPAIPSPKHHHPGLTVGVEDPKEDANGCLLEEPFEFSVYRAQDDSNYPDMNINAASLPGVLWYLHHEVVITCPRKFGVTRIRRLKVTMKNNCDLWKAKKQRFGTYYAFDSGGCGGLQCGNTYDKYGPVVGCQHIPFNTGVFAAYCLPPLCRYAHWYSFPGDCPGSPIGQKTAECNHQHPTGFCKHVTGSRDCTYKIEDAGEVKLSELYDFKGCWSGQMEYNNQTDFGVGIGFWDGIYNRKKCMDRLMAVARKFEEKYPNSTGLYEEPWCDNYKSDPRDFLVNSGSGFHREYHI